MSNSHFQVIPDGYVGSEVYTLGNTTIGPILDQYGQQRVVLGVSGAGISSTNPLPVNLTYDYKNQAGTTSGLSIKTGAGLLHTLTINTPIASTVITVYDGTSTSGTKIATITLPAALLQMGPLSATYDVIFNVGLFIVVATGAADITVAYL